MNPVEKVKSTFCAVGSMLPNLLLLAQGDELRACFLTALTYTAKMYDLDFPACRYRVAQDMLTLGIAINDHYDVGYLDTKNYRQSRQSVCAHPFNQEQYRVYFKTIRKIERGRPSPGNPQDCIAYRKQLNLVSLAINCSFAFQVPLEDMINTQPQVSLKKTTPVWFQPLFHTIMALQVVDDMVGYRGDFLNNRPSFFTAFNKSQGEDLSNSNCVRQHFAQMEELFCTYFNQAKEGDSDYIYPFALASNFIHCFLPPMAEFSRRPILRHITPHFLTIRDTANG